MLAQLPLSKDLVLVGGGHSHALVMRHWAMNPLPGARLTVIDPTPIVAYSGMLPGFVAGHYSQAELSIDLNRLARAAGARLVVGAVSHIDPVRQLVSVPGYPDIGYDAASVDIGITSAMPTLPGFAKHGVPAKPLGPFAERWSAFVARVLAARETDAPLPDDVVIIGGGVAGAELAMAAAYALRGQGGPGARVLLVDRGTALSVLPARTRARMLAGLKAQNVELVEQAQVIAVHAGGVELASGRMLASAFTIGAAGALPHAWLSDCGLQMHEGFLCINAQLQSSDPLIFAAGDCAHMVENPRPKAGVFAVRQAPVLLENLRATLMDTPLRSYHPQHDYLKLISLGGKLALAGKWGFAASGPALWRWKDRIDRKFMNMLADLPQMPQPALPRERAAGLSEAQESTAMCGGCGAKVGRGALNAALSAASGPGRDDILVLPGDDAALLLIGGERQVISTDHLRAFTHDPALMARITAVHALGDIWAMGAAPQAALASVTLPRMSGPLQQRSLGEIMQVANEVMAEAGAQIVGGHSAMGTELTIGFTVTGLCARAPITLAGAQPGDAIIITGPIGSGVILAADMQTKAEATDVLACFAHMSQGQGAASKILAQAHAMTDVTGFGLAGHLQGICAASGCGALLDLAAVPLMSGAEALTAAGVRSTIWDDNRAAAEIEGTDSPRGALLYDPQTAGGLLAAVAPGAAAELLAQLRAAGYGAAIIGEMQAGAAVVSLR